MIVGLRRDTIHTEFRSWFEKGEGPSLCVTRNGIRARASQRHGTEESLGISTHVLFIQNILSTGGGGVRATAF